MSSDSQSFAPTPPRSSSSRSRSLSRRPSQGALATPQRPSASSLSATGGGAPPTPALPNPATTAALLSAATTSPHYTTSLRSRHSLYGTEDRVVLDLGSRIWRVGFSGEPTPRECRSVVSELGKEAAGGRSRGGVQAEVDDAIWGLENREPSEEEWLVREERVKRLLRDVWFNNLMVDPKTRKVIAVENPLLSTAVKDMIARVLFDNLQVPSLSFASAPVLSLLAAGAVTGLVVDVGHLETTVVPVFHSRPLFPLVTSTPRAGSRFNRRLRNLILLYASYVPPPASLTSANTSRPTRVPRALLTEELIEEIKSRICFVGDEITASAGGDIPLETSSETGHAAREASVATTASAMSIDTRSSAAAGASADDDATDPDVLLIKHLAARYSSHSASTTDVAFRIPNLSAAGATNGTGKGWIKVPGWVRERAAEVLWEEGDADEVGLAGVVLECLLKLPTDLKKPLSSSILLTGGTTMLPGFFSRFKASLLSQLAISHPPSPPPSPPLPPSSSSSAAEGEPSPSPLALSARQRRREALALRLHTLRHSPRYAPLVPLAPHLAILNHPAPSPSQTPPASTLARANEGSAPSFSPALQAWVGGSLAGALKTGGVEVARETWDESAGMRERPGEEEGNEEEEASGEEGERRMRGRVPDWAWTRVA
ncbi:hypothetical protein JCM6882_003652 [Rhodosporidiobolus microsporus]